MTIWPVVAAAVVLAAVASVVFLRSSLFRSMIYDVAIVKMTTLWYKSVLERLEPGCRVLDVGIGTGRALLNNAALLKSKRIHVYGIDYDADYVATCRCVRVRARACEIHVTDATRRSVGGRWSLCWSVGLFDRSVRFGRSVWRRSAD